MFRPQIGRVAAHNLGLLAKEVEPELVTKDLLELFTGESSQSVSRHAARQHALVSLG